ncbi:MAG TPA: HAD family phosphatase [Ktedonobacteraceae bacterium]|nr:HAD family phosphatase [Ktedonobacteraceae bacterium]
MAIRAVVFDLGGVLETDIDTKTHAKWEARLNLQAGELRERSFRTGWLLDATYGKLTEEDMLQTIGKVYELDQAQMDEFMQDFWNRYCGELNRELVAYFRSLRPRYQTAILSNGVPGARRVEEERFHFTEVTDLLIYSYEEKTGKPERRIFEITCERLGVQPEEIILLDDIEKTVTAARTFGMHAILFQETTQAIAALEACLQAHAS